MIISDRHRYLFIKLPRTGSTAVHRELCAMYDGEPILTKHATYGDFLKIATEDQKRYFVFSTVRNPLHDAVSKYFKVEGERAAGARVHARGLDTSPRRNEDRLIKIQEARDQVKGHQVRTIKNGSAGHPGLLQSSPKTMDAPRSPTWSSAL